eukprot:Phypoly_transcript_06772.p1 GENE.Phypoly_transcript_06772~~Phypoly_transcript_06772.p1  ORF type:complete len:402 (-),score=59.33 Phypoly_transcript_06772:59-1264(-)
MGDNKEVHALTLKVMRLSKPGFQIVPPLLCEKDDIPGDILSESSRENGSIVEGFGMTSFLQLPTSFGIIYLGETFRIYISLNNPSTIEVYNTSLKVELQTATQLVPLFSNTSSSIDKFAPGVSHDYVVAHEVKEGGVNILACTVTYMRSDNEKKLFKKFFKFQVMNPLTITPRIHTIKNSVFVETNIENSTQSPLYIESVSLIPVDDSLTCTDMNSINPPTQNTPLSSTIVYMKPATARQYLFMLSPTNPEAANNNSSVIGQLDITWRSTLGEVGRIKSLPLQKKAISTDEVELTLTSIPPRIVLEQPFVVTLQVTNRGTKLIQPQLVVLKNIMDGLLVNGHLEQDLGELKQEASKTLSLHMFPVKPGIQKITGLSVRVPDGGSFKAYEFNNLADVFVDHV